MYSLDSVWLLQADCTKLDGFHARCLRIICGIAPSFVSRVTNAVVFQTAGKQPLSTQLLANQLLYYGRVSQLHERSLVRQMFFEGPDSIHRDWHSKRNIGRPRLQWVGCVHALAMAVAECSQSRLADMLARGPATWANAVWEYLLT